MPTTKVERLARKLIHSKQERLLVKDGVPTVSDLVEGVATYRKTKEGLVQYVKHANVLYKNVMKLASKADTPSAAVSTTTTTIDPSDGIISQTLASDGYAKFGAGLIIQWGTKGDGTSDDLENHEDVIFPLTFPNNVFVVLGTHGQIGTDTGGGDYEAQPRIASLTTSGVTFSTASNYEKLFWYAIGN